MTVVCDQCGQPLHPGDRGWHRPCTIARRREREAARVKRREQRERKARREAP